ncbi:MAG: phosphoribosylformylglycinamidine synthase [Muribaculaceae bacterium]|nr:phosphoribosylformylglycinamidine synthase [Muribaculaceae bacterium]
MKAKRIFVEKREKFRTEAESLRNELNLNLGLNLKELKLFTIYDLFGFDGQLLEKSAYKVFAEPATDSLYSELELDGKKFLAIEFLPGQFDQRASSAEDCVRLLSPASDINIRSGKLMVFDDDLDGESLAKIAKYCINPVEAREKNLDILKAPENVVPEKEKILEGFIDITPVKAKEYCRLNGLAMNGDDLMEVVNYFRKEKRNPTLTELKILDTYWSDHCRHTTFTSELTEIEVEDSQYAAEINRSIADWNAIRKELGRESKPLCLMDLATIGARYLVHTGQLANLEQSEENNACSVYVDLETDGKTERWLLQFKNETHNHPTEIEPFGGASTCLGGAVRDPLSGRAYVYQAMRVTGAGDIYQEVKDTLPGKLPQKIISLRAAGGYSSYGNQLGLATTHVREIYHPGYVAKRLEVGAVVGAVKASDVRRESPKEGDVIIMLGGRTGRDGIGGATGSSKQHTGTSLDECGSEVQKGNPPEERKIQRLFRRPEVTRLIKKSNDFGAGGVSVAIGELADGLDIYLDRVKTKYSGLSATDLAISESQERMAVVVESNDLEEFRRLCDEENIESVHVADVTSTGRMRLFLNGEPVADLSREFIDSAGARHYAKAKISAPSPANPMKREYEGDNLGERFEQMLSDDNVTSQKGLIEMFDSSIGASTVMMPFGGKTQRTESQVSVQSFPTGNRACTIASLMSFGFNPYLSSWSPYHGAVYAVVESIAKAVAAGADYRDLRFSFQEYFERMSSREAWGKPLAALLGALKMQLEFGVAAIGGKDSMSGSFENLNVPPTLISFAVGPVDSRFTVSPEFKEGGQNIYLLTADINDLYLPNIDILKKSYEHYHQLVSKGKVSSAWAVGFGGIGEGLAKMSFGNNIGAQIETEETGLFDWHYGSIIFTTDEAIEDPSFRRLGKTSDKPELNINGCRMPIEKLYECNVRKFAKVYPDKTELKGDVENATSGSNKTVWKGEKTANPVVYLPVFPGTNCDYDMADAFEREGGQPVITVFRNLDAKAIEESIEVMARNIDEAHILALSGGFSAGDEPDGSGKYIASILMNGRVKEAIERLLDRGGLILGICNGFQALIKSGLLPFGKIGELSQDSPTLTRNDINRHISQIVVTRTGSVASPWLDEFELGELFSVAASHGEGKFVAGEALAAELMRNGQVAFQYADSATGHATMQSPENPNGSTMAIEGIISPNGQILGKMAHSERYRKGLMRNIHGNKEQNIFRNAINYFNKQQ